MTPGSLLLPTLPSSCGGHATAFLHLPDRHTSGVECSSQGRKADKVGGRKHNLVLTLSTLTQKEWKAIPWITVLTFYDVVFFLQELALPSRTGNTLSVSFHAMKDTSGSPFPASCFLQQRNHNQPPALACKLQHHEKPSLRSFLWGMAQRNKKAEKVYATAKHKATLQTMTQRVRQKEERGENREADGGQHIERKTCDCHQRNVE